MSRSRAPSPGRTAHDPVRSVLVVVWHAACGLALGGCFYVKPIPDVQVNEPPLIRFPDTEAPYPVRVIDGTVRMTIRASDPEGGPLWFFWPDLEDVQHEPEDFASGPFWVSTRLVTRPDLLREDPDGVVRVVAEVVDDEDENVRFVTFELVQP